ncbi:MAG: hypothetical protein FWD31_03705 [Planctomycetaceae bacterium]|nr:hypothetical protein [Planctomycetaceae bacterium]
MKALVPQLDGTTLSPAERRRMLGSGVRRYGFIDLVSDTAAEWPQFWPEYVDDVGREHLKELIREIEVLRNLRAQLETVLRAVMDLLLVRGGEAFRMATKYYATVRDAARQQEPGAAALFDLLRLFWKRRRSSHSEPTEQEAIHDFKAVLHGMKDGTVAASNESDTVTEGHKTVVDNVRPKRSRAAAKVEEQEDIG